MTDDPSVGLLATVREVVGGATSCADLDALFQSDPQLHSVLVRVDGGISLLHRSEFYQAITGPLGFGRPLHYHRPVSRVTRPADEPIDASMDAADAWLLLLRAGHHGDHDVLVQWPDGRLGTLAASLLYRQLADVHARRADHIAASERWFRSLVQNSSDVTIVVDRGGRVRYRTSSAGRVTGRVGELMDEDVLRFVHPADRQELERMLEQTTSEPDANITSAVRMEVAGLSRCAHRTPESRLLHRTRGGGRPPCAARWMGDRRRVLRRRRLQGGQ